MPKYLITPCLVLLFLLSFGTANAQEMDPPPPLPDLNVPLPPDRNSLPPPPELAWEPVTGDSTIQSAPPSLPPALFAPPSSSTWPIVPFADPVLATFIEEDKNPVEYQLATPRFEIWRAEATEPEEADSITQSSLSTLIAPGNPIWIRLLFDPSMTGESIAITLINSVILQPPGQFTNVGASGECFLLVDMNPNTKEDGEITFTTKQVSVSLKLIPASEELIATHHN